METQPETALEPDLPAPVELPAASDSQPAEASAEPTPAEEVKAGAALEQRRFSSRSDASAGSPHHFKHRSTLLKRLKSIGHKARELSNGGRASPIPGSPSFPPNRRASMSCRARVPQPVLEDEQEDLASRERPRYVVFLPFA